MSQTTSPLTAWYINRNGSASGPFATDMLISMLRDGSLQPLDLVFREGESEWRPVATYRELKKTDVKLAESKASDSKVSDLKSPEPKRTDKKKPEPEAKSEPKSENKVESKSDTQPDVKPDVAIVDRVATRERIEATMLANGIKPLSWIVLRSHNSTYLQEGPFDTATIIEGLQTGRFQFSQYAWHVGMPRWMRIGDLREFDRRARSRDTKPHVPPPLPDPIAAVLLEDDKDLEAEEFHVVMHGMTKMDMTPNPLESMQALNVTKLGNVGIGGAAADNPEEKSAQERAGHAVSLVVSTPNLANVPWEQDFSERYPQSRELIDDESSGIHRPPLEADSYAGADAETGFEEKTGVVAIPMDEASFDIAFERPEQPPPLPFVPAAPMPLAKDGWEKWGRYIAGTAMAGLFGVFTLHVILTKNEPTEAPQTVAEAPAVAVPVQEAPAQPAAPRAAPVSSTEPTSTASAPAPAVAAEAPPAPPAPAVEFNVVGLKLDRPDGQIVIQGSFGALSPETPIQVTIKGRLGQILSNMSVRKIVKLERKGGEIPSLKLRDLKLPTGAYTVEVSAGGATAKNEIFVGQRDAKFMSRLESHLRDISLETQTQKKALFYTAKELDQLARELGQNYGQLRGKSEAWTKFFGSWKKRMDGLQRGLSDVAKKSVEDQAYPEETAALSQAFASLREVGTQFEQAVAQKRDVASDSLTELISELTRQKEAIGEATARPTADTPDGML